MLLIAPTGCREVFAPQGVQSEELPARTVNVVRIAQTNQYNQVASYFGTLQPSRRARLAFGVPGKVALVSKSVGEEVKAGEIIAQFDIVRLESDRQRVSGLLESAQASQTQQPTTRLSDLEDQLAKLELQIENSILVAPFSGTLSRLDVWAGQMTGPGNVLAEVVSDSPPVVEVSIAAKTAQAQFVGRQLEVVMEDSVTAEAVIKSVATLVDRSTRTRRVMLEITSDLSSVTYTFGGIVKVSFDSFRQATGFWLPLSAMQKRAGGLWSTMVLESVGDRTIAGLRAIEVVYVENDTAYVTGALKDGDLVIADGTHRIVPGQNVVAVPENGKGSSALDTPDRLERSSP